MLRKLFVTIVLLLAPLVAANAQKKEIAQAKANIKAGKSLAETETSMRKLLQDSVNRQNDRIWMLLFDAVKKQYDVVNEQMYLKQTADTAKLFDAAWRMFGVLEGLDSVEAARAQGNNAKLKYRKRHSETLNAYRRNIYNGGLYYIGKKNFGRAFDFFSTYIDCAAQPLFASYNYSASDRLIPQAAFYAVHSGYWDGNADRTLRYANIAESDTARLEQVYLYEAETYRKASDTVSFKKVLETAFQRYPRSEYFFPHLFDLYFQSGDMAGALSLCDNALLADSTDNVVLFAKSSVLLREKKYNECVDICDRIVAADSTFADAYLNAGLAFFNQTLRYGNDYVQIRKHRQEINTLYRKALPYMQNYRRLAPGELERWAMPLYTIYLNLNMGKEFDEIDALMKNKESGK